MPPSTDRDGAAGADGLVAAATGVLALLWWAGYNLEAVPFFPVILAGAAASAVAGRALRRRLDGPPPVGAAPRLVAAALAVAVAHWALGRLLFELAGSWAPWLRADAAAVFARVGALPVGVQAVLAGVVVAPLEEVWWRGAFHPWVVRRASGRPRGTGFALAVAGYTLFHVVTLRPSLVAAAALGGVVWGGLLARTRSLGAVAVAHGAWTTLMVLAPPG